MELKPEFRRHIKRAAGEALMQLEGIAAAAKGSPHGNRRVGQICAWLSI